MPRNAVAFTFDVCLLLRMVDPICQHSRFNPSYHHYTCQASCSLTEVLSPPSHGFPQVITEPLLFTAANALKFPATSWTSLSSCSITEALLPPSSRSPQVTTEPALFKAAKANRVA